MAELFVTGAAEVDLLQISCKQLPIPASGTETSQSAPHGSAGAWPRLASLYFRH
jgi:hypothetical protein